MVDRNLHPRHIPNCFSNVEPVDQYLWNHRDQNTHLCNNGISRPIYDYNGNISFSLPLEHYPQRYSVHPEVVWMAHNTRVLPNRSINSPSLPSRFTTDKRNMNQQVPFNTFMS